MTELRYIQIRKILHSKNASSELASGPSLIDVLTEALVFIRNEVILVKAGK